MQAGAWDGMCSEGSVSAEQMGNRDPMRQGVLCGGLKESLKGRWLWGWPLSEREVVTADKYIWGAEEVRTRTS